MYKSLVDRTFQLSDLMCGAAGVHLFTTVAVANGDRQVLACIKAWAGGPPEEESRASIIGPMKALELLIDFAGPMSMTPTGNPVGCGYLGGVRRRSTDEPESHFLTSGSAWSGECDAQMALLLNYAMSYEVRFHHVGFRHPTRASMLKAVEADQQRLGVSAIVVPAEDHERYYLPAETDAHPNGLYWIEHQFFPEGKKDFAIHWDVATMEPLGLLDFIAGHLGTKAITWEAGPNDPIGMTWQANRDRVPYGIMARPRWWNIG